MSDIAKKLTVEDMLHIRNKIASLYEELLQKKKEIDTLSKSIGTGYLTSTFERSHKPYQKELDCVCWRYLLNTIGLFNSMTEKAKKDFHMKIEESPPTFNAQEIQSLAQNVSVLYEDSAKQTILEVYHRLIGCHYSGNGWRGKKDNLQKVEKVFRIQGGVYWDTMFSRYNIRQSPLFEDLLTSCYLLDGLQKPNYSMNFYCLSEEAFKNRSDIVETPYFSVKCYKNGNQKVTWKEDKLEILNRLNLAGSRGQLPDVMRKRYKPEHF